MRFFSFFFFMILPISAQNWQALWPDSDAPGAKRPPPGTEEFKNERYYMIEQPEYELHKAKGKNTGKAVVIFPGGGYGMISTPNEGHPFGQWLAENGITAIVVKYRVDHTGKTLGYHYPIPLLDARRAIRTMRFHAKDWDVQANKIGVLGFSAGGHLAAMTATLFEETFETETQDPIDQVNCRPDFAALIYPVICMHSGFRHKGSARLLTGGDAKLESFLSLQDRVTEKTPPCLIVHSADDPAVPVENALMFASACAAKKVPLDVKIYRDGGHGFGFTGRQSTEGWTELLHGWLKDQ